MLVFLFAFYDNSRLKLDNQSFCYNFLQETNRSMQIFCVRVVELNNAISK